MDYDRKYIFPKSKAVLRQTLPIQTLISWYNIYMAPRNYHFQYMHPEVAKEYHAELSAFIPNIWNRIGHYSGLDKFFTFTPMQNPNKIISDQTSKPSDLV